MALVKVDTFNLNNPFSRYNFQGEIQAIAAGDNTVEALYEFTDLRATGVRTFMGRLVKGKDPQDTVRIATRIASMDLRERHALRHVDPQAHRAGRSDGPLNANVAAAPPDP
jgi:hypothetical protein